MEKKRKQEEKRMRKNERKNADPADLKTDDDSQPDTDVHADDVDGESKLPDDETRDSLSTV